MAVDAISPWPKRGPNLELAISYLKDEISPGMSNASVERLGAVGASLVERYAPRAPDPIKTEAVIRVAGYSAEIQRNGYGALRSEAQDVGDLKFSGEFIVNHSASFRNCGAMSLLSPWKIRRAGTLKIMEIQSMNSEQLPAVDLVTVPQNLATALPEGNYQFQVVAATNGAVALYGFGDAPPADEDDFFRAEFGDIVEFSTVNGSKLWARKSSTVVESVVTLALAKLNG